MTRKSYELDDDLIAELKGLIQQFIAEERPVRERQIRLWKKLEYYWSGYTRLWWSDVAHDWRVYDYNYSTDDGQASYYDKPINVYRAYLESIIAALSSTVPGLKATPDDADNTLDCTTAKGATKIGELVYKHIDAPLLWCKALYVLCNQGMVAAYNYSVEDKKYGEVEVGKYEDTEETISTTVCPMCKMPLSPQDQEAAIQLEENEEDEFDPGDDDVVLHAAINDGKLLCVQCQLMVDPEILENKVIVNRLVGVTKQPKSRQCIEVNGGLYVRVANYARCQEDAPYLGYCYETHYTNIYAKYPHLRDRRDEIDSRISTDSGNDVYERYGRLSPQYYGQYPKDTPTVGNWWLRPSVFEGILDDKKREKLKRLFPDGVKIVFINDDTFAEACNESLDDHWTLTYNPLSEYVHFDPLGYLLVSVQDITSDLISLTLQTIEHGIPQTFIDPTVVDFNAYRESPATPGAIYPAKAKGGKSLGDSFLTIKTATLSQEVGPFGDKINELGQLVSGALPSMWGGGGTDSRTASQYSMQRSQALQRLQTTWKMINYWWKDIFGKVVPAYIKTMLEDERIVKEQHDSYVNVVIRMSEMQGKLGEIELEGSDQIPETAGAVKDALMQLLQLGNPEILAALAQPENIPLLTKAIGLESFKMPGEADREKQYEEISQLIATEPIPDATGGEMSSIEPDPDVDNHAVEAEICRDWLVGEAGRQAKVMNPTGYRNVLLHMKMHQMMQQQQMMQQMAMAQPQQQPQQQGQMKPVGAQ